MKRGGDIFSDERGVSEWAQARLDEAPPDAPLHGPFSELVQSYDRLLKLAARLVAISDRQQQALRESEAQIRYHAYHDLLTGLPNRSHFFELIHKAAQHARRYDRHCGLLFIDLDGMKGVNDVWGHAQGDRLLAEVAGRFRRAVRAADSVCRLGGDEFTVVAFELPDAAALEQVAHKILEVTEGPVEIGGQMVRVSASIGLALFPDDAQDVDSLVNRADAAMYAAKAAGGNRLRRWQPAEQG